MSKFVVFEGVDGSGKSDVSAMFAGTLMAEYGAERVLLTSEPDDSCAAGLYIRALLENRHVTGLALPLAFALNRFDHCLRIIAPALAEGKIVVCDRYLLSSLVYQTDAEVTTDDIKRLNREAIQPDLTFFLRVSAETALKRLAARGKAVERFEEHAAVASAVARYRSEVALLQNRHERVVTIDAEGTLGSTQAQVMEVWRRLG